MNSKFLNNYFFILFSLIPISLIVGPAVSLVNILLIDLSFIIFIFYTKKTNIFNHLVVRILIILYIYLIFNSFIALDFSLSANRNFGFIRFIILFISFNYFFYHNKYFFSRIFVIWTLTLTILCMDAYLESFTGKNILGYGEQYGRRIVSFFKDEPIVGGYINGFYLLIVGYIYITYKNYSDKYKLFFLIFSLLIFSTILLTGERSNTIKAFIGFLIFFLTNGNFNIKQKMISILTTFILIGGLYSNSDFLNLRYKGQFIDQINSKEKLFKYYNENKYFKIYSSGFNVFKNYPIFGVGNKNYRLETCEKNNNNNKKYYCTTHPHQTYFEFLSEHGLVGSLIILIIFFKLIFSQSIKILKSKNYLQIGCFIYLFTIFIPILPSGAFFNDFNLTLFWINFSLMYACNNQTNIFYEQNLKLNIT